jgi:hypothetical protein
MLVHLMPKYFPPFCTLTFVIIILGLGEPCHLVVSRKHLHRIMLISKILPHLCEHFFRGGIISSQRSTLAGVLEPEDRINWALNNYILEDIF